MMGVGYYGKKAMANDRDNEFWEKVAFYNRADWKLAFVFFPKKCSISGKKLWLCYAYMGTANYYAGDAGSVVEHKWHDKLEHLIWLLKK